MRGDDNISGAPVKPGRIPCINPNCRRTFAVEKVGIGEEIICGKCWKNLPVGFTRIYKSQRRRYRKAERRYEKTGADRDRDRIERMWPFLRRSWDRIWLYYNKPQEPDGLTKFLDDMGM